VVCVLVAVWCGVIVRVCRGVLCGMCAVCVGARNVCYMRGVLVVLRWVMCDVRVVPGVYAARGVCAGVPRVLLCGAGCVCYAWCARRCSTRVVVVVVVWWWWWWCVYFVCLCVLRGVSELRVSLQVVCGLYSGCMWCV
jgi:hypothetical protein